MATLQTMREGGTQHPEEIMNAFMTQLVRVSGVINKGTDNHFLVEEADTPAMSVDVREGSAFIVTSDNSMAYPVNLTDGDATVSISSNSSGNPRIDAIVLYIDVGASANATVTNVAKLAAVEGTPAGSPTAPTDNDISTDIGASNPFLRLADVQVDDGETTILDADITDQRVKVKYHIGQAVDEDDANAALISTVKARAYLSATQENLANNTWTKVALDDDSTDPDGYDPGSNFDAVTNNRFTAPVDGYYLISGVVNWAGASLTADKNYSAKIYKDGTTDLGIEVDAAGSGVGAGDGVANMITVIAKLSASSYVELWASQRSGTATVDISGGASLTYMEVHLLSTD